MCTIGFTRLAGDDYLLFKNKDFPRRSFEDAIVMEREVFGIAGVSTWSDPDPVTDRFSGMSLGANAAGLLCADANVSGASGLANYDELVEIALRAGGGVAEGIAAIEAAVAAQPYLWGNIVMIDGASGAAIEVRGAEVVVTAADRPTARSNHHVLLSTSQDPSVSPTTGQRLAAAQTRLDVASTLDEVVTLLRAHDEGESGICNHIVSQTVYSYVLRRCGDETTLYVAKGHPCLSDTSLEVTVPIGENWSTAAVAEFSRAYPSARVGSGL